MIDTNSNNSLFYYRRSPVSLVNAAGDFLASCGSETVAFLYSPGQFLVARYTDSGFESPKGEISSEKLNSVYSARLFNENAELRWQQRPGRTSEAVAVGESKLDLDKNNGWEKKEEERQIVDIVDQRFICWGKYKADASGSGWGRLIEDRIEPIAVYVKGNNDDRIQLEWKEYLAEADGYGNVVAVDERLVKLLPYKRQTEQKTKVTDDASK
jgi:CRISPR-associated protein (TIGR03984 family)